jgi:hypothetical protein
LQPTAKVPPRQLCDFGFPPDDNGQARITSMQLSANLKKAIQPLSVMCISGQAAFLHKLT